MGGSQSASASTATSSSGGVVAADYPLLFDYECNPYVAEFIRNKRDYLDELNIIIQAYAEVQQIFSTHSKGIVKLKAKLVSLLLDADSFFNMQIIEH